MGTFRHLMVYVSDLAVSMSFYEQVLGFLGYELAHSADTYAMWARPEGGATFGIVQAEASMTDDPYIRGRAGFHHLAFNADGRDQIDALYNEVLLKIDATVLDPPVACSEYSPTYYAVYFEDPDGLKLELAHS